MEKYDVDNHLFYDGYDIDNKLLSNLEFISNLVQLISKEIFGNSGIITVIPYFDGKVREDGGISAIILGNNFHFTCHTFCYKNTVFVDYYGDDSKKEDLKCILLDVFNTNNFDMGSKDVKGNFGKHIIIKPHTLSFDEAISMSKRILVDINVTPITNLLTSKTDDNNFDILQPIAESHISFHRSNDEMVVDAFSCKDFDTDGFLRLFNYPKDCVEVHRGLQYKKTISNKIIV